MIKAKGTSGRAARKKKPKSQPRIAMRPPGDPPLSDVYVRMMQEVARELGDDRVVVPAVDGYPRLS